VYTCAEDKIGDMRARVVANGNAVADVIVQSYVYHVAAKSGI